MSRITVQKLGVLSGHKDSIYTLSPSAQGTHFFSAAGDGMVVQWDMESPENGNLIAKLPNSIYALHYHEPTGLLAVGHNYDGVHLLDPKTKQEVGSINITKGAIFDIKSYEDKLYVATGDGELVVLALEGLSVLGRIQASNKSARTIALHPENREVAVGFSDHHIRIYDIDSGMLKKTLEGHTNSVFTLCYTPDRSILISSGRDARLKFWDVRAGYLLMEDIAAHMYAINHITFSPDGKHFVTCSMDKSIKIWDAQRLKLLKVIDKVRHAGHGTSVNRLLWTAHKGQLLSASDDRTISLWGVQF